MSCILTGGHPLGSFPRSDPDHSEPPHRHSQPVARPKHYSRNGSRQPWSLATDMHSQRPSDGCATSSEKIIVLTKEICPPPVLQQLFYIVVFLFLFLKLECRLYLRLRNVSQTSTNPDHMVNSDSSSLLLKRKCGTTLPYRLPRG